MEWYVSRRSLRVGHARYFCEGTSPYNEFAFEPGPLGELARSLLRTQTRYERMPWLWPLRGEWGRVSRLTWVEIDVVTAAIARLIAGAAIYFALRDSLRPRRRDRRNGRRR